MNTHDAMALIADAVTRRGGTWADIGAGDGTFTRALAALLGPDGRIYAVDRDASALVALERWAATQEVDVIPVLADFTRPFELPGLDDRLLDGILLANALHFVPDAATVLARLAALVRDRGRVVIVEYDQRGRSAWVPYPISAAHLAVLAASARLSSPAIVATRPSAYGGILYVATAERLASERGEG